MVELKSYAIGPRSHILVMVQEPSLEAELSGVGEMLAASPIKRAPIKRQSDVLSSMSSPRRLWFPDWPSFLSRISFSDKNPSLSRRF